MSTGTIPQATISVTTFPHHLADSKSHSFTVPSLQFVTYPNDQGLVSLVINRVLCCIFRWPELRPALLTLASASEAATRAALAANLHRLADTLPEQLAAQMLLPTTEVCFHAL